jgi:hypothetical protein
MLLNEMGILQLESINFGEEASKSKLFNTINDHYSKKQIKSK